ncbi:MAG: hypothetical protein ACTSRG_15430 [Candidatus Helarchaeota archaeon]
MGNGVAGIIFAIVGAAMVIFGVYLIIDYFQQMQSFVIFAFLIPQLSPILTLIIEISWFIFPKATLQFDLFIYIGIGLAVLGSIIAAVD